MLKLRDCSDVFFLFSDKDIDELDENDIEKYTCQLMNIGLLARITAHTALPMLCRLVKRSSSFSGHF